MSCQRHPCTVIKPQINHKTQLLFVSLTIIELYENLGLTMEAFTPSLITGTAICAQLEDNTTGFFFQKVYEKSTPKIWDCVEK